MRKVFEQELISFLQQLVNRSGQDVLVTPTTELFKEKLISSFKILAVMGFVESKLGVQISDDMLTMEYFSTPGRIVENFCAAGEKA